MRSLWPLTVRGTGALVLALACFVVANQLGLAELVYFGVLLLAVLAAALASLFFSRRTDTVTRSVVPDVSTVGRETAVTVRVGVRTAVPSAPGVWRDAVSRGLQGHPEGTFPAIGSGLRGGERSVEFGYTVTGVRRGVHPLGPLSVTSSDPFGLARRRSTFGERTRVIVAPAVVELSALSDSIGDTGGALHSTTNQLGQGADNLVARPYAPGDSMRRIHWRATAHRDTLMVRQEEQESTPEAIVVLDRSLPRWAPAALQMPGADPGFEAAVTACVSVVTRLVHDGYAVEVIDSDGAALAEPVDGGDLTELEALITSFATLTARRDDKLPQLTRVFAGSMTGPIVVITGKLDATDAAALAPVVHHCTLPVLLAVSPEADALDRAAGFGWRTAEIGADTDLATAWIAAADRGFSRVFD